MHRHGTLRAAMMLAFPVMAAVIASPAAGGTDAVYVCGWFSHNVIRFDTNGAFQQTILTGANGLANAHSVEFGPDGHLYVSSFGVHKVIRYDGASGALIDVFVENVAGTPQDESGGLLNAHGMAFGRDGNLYVASFGSDQVKRYIGATGAFIDTFICGAGLDGPIAVRFAIQGDLDHNGVVDTVDFLTLLGNWGPCPAPCPPTCLSDLNGDCAVDTVDFLILLANWG